MNVSGFVFTATNKWDPTSLHDMSTIFWQWLRKLGSEKFGVMEIRRDGEVVFR